MTSLDQALSSSEKHAGDFKLTLLPIPPAPKLAVIACRDAQWTVDTMRGLNKGDAHILRHAGGVSSENALRSLLVSRNPPGTTSS